eukprot:4366736-Prymnesium_polylepis.1
MRKSRPARGFALREIGSPAPARAAMSAMIPLRAHPTMAIPSTAQHMHFPRAPSAQNTCTVPASQVRGACA